MADAKIINYGQQISAGSTAIPDNTSEALDIESTDGSAVITVDTSDGAEITRLSAAGAAGVEVHATNAGGGNNAEVRFADEIGFISDPDTSIRRKTNNALEFRIAGSDTLGITASGVFVENGNFGINTLTPATKFECNGAATTIGAISTAITGTFTATQGSDVINAGSSTAFLTELHVGSAIKIPSDVAAGFEIFTVDGITSDTILSLDSNYLGSTRATSGGAFTDGGELFAVKTGDSKTLFGVNETGAIQAGSAAADASASNNIAIGDSTALDAITTGTKNFILGTSSDNYKLTTGHSNVFAGYRAGEDCTGSNNSVIIGNQAGCVNNIGNNSTLVGAGAGVEATGNGNTALGMSSLYSCSSGSNNVGIGYSAGSALTGGTDCVMLGKEAQPSTGNGANQIAIGKGAAGHADNKATIGNANITSIDPHSDRGCDLGQVAYEFDAVHCVSVTEVSDERLKENISDTAMGLDFINALRPVSYKFKNIEHQTKTIEQLAHRQVVDDNGELVTESFTEEHEVVVHPGKVHTRHHQGLIAQEVKTVLDSMEISAADFGGFVDGNVVDGVDKLALRYTQFIGPLIKSVQELTSQNESLAARIATLEAGD